MGAGVTTVKEGDRVGVPWLYSACGHCEYCLTAWETVCAQAEFGGYTKNGGFAEYILADPSYVAHVPAGLAAKDAAAIICAGITTYKGIKETEAKAGDWIAVSGAGGLGHLAIQYAKAMGLHVCAVDIDDGSLCEHWYGSRLVGSEWWKTQCQNQRRLPDWHGGVYHRQGRPHVRCRYFRRKVCLHRTAGKIASRFDWVT